MALSPSATIRTAIELKKAIDGAAELLRPIGFCPTITDEWRAYHYGEDMDDDDEEAGERKEGTYKELMQDLSEIKREHNSPSFVGSLEAPFSLTITRPTCEFTGEIVPNYPDETGDYDSSAADEAIEKTEDEAAENAKKSTAVLLKKWFEGGAVSGYGDIQAQETKVDPSVRNAREIPATEFTVGPELLESVRKHWADHFFPTLVRVEPYKIHLYGPGGKFKEHRDTPEMDLVGTFIVGLGDTTGGYREGELLVKALDGWEVVKAYPGSWVAFYPDVKHEVTEIKNGYRAALAFKIFRLPGIVEDPMDYVAHSKIKEVLDKMPRKYGLLLERQYCKGTTQLSGFDAQLFAAAKTRREVDSHLLPVLIKFDGLKEEGECQFGRDSACADVFPLTETHIDALLKSFVNNDSDDSSSEGEGEDDNVRSLQQKNPLELSLKGTEVAWIEEHQVTKVPFYSLDSLPHSRVVWRRIKQGGAEYTGNEAKPTKEDSIYLSYAMVVVPKAHEKRKREESDEGNER